MTTHPIKRCKKLIEVAIPLEAINTASAREKIQSQLAEVLRQGHRYLDSNSDGEACESLR